MTMRGFHRFAQRHHKCFTNKNAKSSNAFNNNSSTNNAWKPSQQPNMESTRSIHGATRRLNQFQQVKSALACECSSLRYSNYLFSTEDSLPRGWDEDILMEDDDGT
jgi:hypothetical protein